MGGQRSAGKADESRSAARGRLDHGGQRRSFNREKSAASQRSQSLSRLSPLQGRSDRVEQSDRLRQSQARRAARSRSEVPDTERGRTVPRKPSRALRQSQDRGKRVRQHDCALAEKLVESISPWSITSRMPEYLSQRRKGRKGNDNSELGALGALAR